MTSSWDAWRTAVLLFLFMAINFSDRIILGLAGIPIMTELGLTPEEFGRLGSAFFYLFAVSAIAVGIISAYVPIKSLILVLALIWAAVQFPMAGEVDATIIFVCRLILGAGEGPAFAMALVALYKWFPDHKRGLPTAIVAQGATFGAIVSIPALNWLIVDYSWHSAFLAMGGIGLAWCVAWIVWGKDGPNEADSPSEVSLGGLRTYPTIGAALLSSTFIGCCIMTFASYWVVSTAFTWQTPFIVYGLGYSQSSAGTLSAMPWIFGAIVMLVAGWMSGAMLDRGTSSTLARGVLGSAPLVAGGLCLLAMPLVAMPAIKVVLLSLSTGLAGAIYVVCAPMIAGLIPDQRRNVLLAVYCAAYSLGGIAAPMVLGKYVQGAQTPLEGFQQGFLTLGVLLLVSGLAGLVLLRPDTEYRRRAQTAE